MKSAVCVVLAGLMVWGASPQKHWHEDDDHWQKHWKHHDGDDDDDRDDDRGGSGCYLGLRDLRIISDYYAPR